MATKKAPAPKGIVTAKRAAAKKNGCKAKKPALLGKKDTLTGDPVLKLLTEIRDALAPESAAAVEEPVAVAEEPAVEEAPKPKPRKTVVFIGSECYPFVKTGGLGDVMYALPKPLVQQGCEVRVIIPRYSCIPEKYQEKMIYRGSFYMDLCSDGRQFYVGLMEYIWDGVIYDFIDNQEFFSWGKPYTNLVDDIPKYCYFAKASLAALNYMNVEPDIIHCHDWQAALVPVFLKTRFNNTPLGAAKSVITIHNLRFQGSSDIRTLQYWTNLPGEVFTVENMVQDWPGANMLKGGLAYADMITTVSNTYAEEIQTEFYGERLDGHLRYHSQKLRGIVNGIDCVQWNPATDSLLAANYTMYDAIDQKKANKRALQEKMGLEVDDNKMVLGLISRLTDQKGLDLINDIFPNLIDGNTQVVVLGTGDPKYEESFRRYGNLYPEAVAACIMYDESLAHLIYAGSDALLVPSLFEPCGLTQLIAMRYGTLPIVRETGGLKDTVAPCTDENPEGNGFTFVAYRPNLLLDAINHAKTVYFTRRDQWDATVLRDLAKDVSWDASAQKYLDIYDELKP